MDDNTAHTDESSSTPRGARLRTVQGAAVAGVLAAVGWIFALSETTGLPPLDATDAEITTYYRELGGFDAMAIRLQALTFATFGFLWFIGVIRGRIGQNEPKLFGTVFLGSGIMLAILLFVGFAVAVTPTLLMNEGGRLVDPDVSAATRAFGQILLSFIAPRVASLFIFSMSSLALRARAMPMWLIVGSYLAGLANLANVTFTSTSLYLFPVWMIVVSGYLLIAGRHVQEVADAERSSE